MIEPTDEQIEAARQACAMPVRDIEAMLVAALNVEPAEPNAAELKAQLAQNFKSAAPPMLTGEQIDCFEACLSDLAPATKLMAKWVCAQAKLAPSGEPAAPEVAALSRRLNGCVLEFKESAGTRDDGLREARDACWNQRNPQHHEMANWMAANCGEFINALIGKPAPKENPK